MQTAADVMTAPVVKVTPDTTIESATRLMLQHRISGIPVCDAAGAPVGILTEGDLLRRVEIGTEPRHSRWRELFGPVGKAAREYVHTHSRRVADIMTSTVHSVAPETPLDEVVSMMEKRHIKRVPVVSQGRMVGIVSRASLVAALVEKLALLKVADTLETKSAGLLTDEELKTRIWREIRAEYWAPRGTINLVVNDGVVELDGVIYNEYERQALKVAVENVPGVKSVIDGLVWVEPVSGTVVLPGAGQS